MIIIQPIGPTSVRSGGTNELLGTDREQGGQLDGGNSNILGFSPLFGEGSHFDEYFSKGLKPTTRQILSFFFLRSVF